MIYWIRKFARILGMITFFSIMILHFSGPDPLEYTSLLSGLFNATLGASIIWFAGFIIGDIFFKGVLTDIEPSRDNLVEGGMVQQIHMKKERNIPGGEERPFTEKIVTINRKKGNAS